MRVLVAGDVHGNTTFVQNYVFPVAEGVNADVILQLGDYGFWEHSPDGVEFNDAVARSVQRTGIPLYFVRGNHDNIGLLRSKYHRDDNRSVEGFYKLRDGLYHIPDGLHWNWNGTRFAAFGGAYSVDKAERLKIEADITLKRRQANEGRIRAGVPVVDYPPAEGSVWFPDEELTDAEVDALLAADPSTVDVVVSHDKPLDADAGEFFRRIAACQPNQRRLQRVMAELRPKLWLHGHLHHRYMTSVDAHPVFGPRCTVIGLSCDDSAAQRFWRPTESWLLLELGIDGSMPLHMPDTRAPEFDLAIERAIDEHYTYLNCLGDDDPAA